MRAVRPQSCLQGLVDSENWFQLNSGSQRGGRGCGVDDRACSLTPRSAGLAPRAVPRGQHPGAHSEDLTLRTHAPPLEGTAGSCVPGNTSAGSRRLCPLGGPLPPSPGSAHSPGTDGEHGPGSPSTRQTGAWPCPARHVHGHLTEWEQLRTPAGPGRCHTSPPKTERASPTPTSDLATLCRGTPLPSSCLQ